ncbi:hypothetical protein M378DRAFT_166349 [Amanita muscaria Koide BX008]|uniref:Uncharacterized protein n=1 Tax=Amanita muscaria (strain Koide BX008) TaxID=946122 RepID=A0A0C2WZM0_AMAMK|nr:hypothetical protein M378DRAFT_166349 [Amanita muscaria Koide BX008]
MRDSTVNIDIAKLSVHPFTLLLSVSVLAFPTQVLARFVLGRYGWLNAKPVVHRPHDAFPLFQTSSDC